MRLTSSGVSRKLLTVTIWAALLWADVGIHHTPTLVLPSLVRTTETAGQGQPVRSGGRTFGTGCHLWPVGSRGAVTTEVGQAEKRRHAFL